MAFTLPYLTTCEFISLLPSLKSFISQGILPAATSAISKLVNNDGHTSSLYEEFDAQLEKNGRTKKFRLFKAAAIMWHLKYIQNLDLELNKLATLETYHIDCSFNVVQATSQLNGTILERFCKRASSDLCRQHGREYGFSNEGRVESNTDLSTISSDILEKLPVNNLDCEYDFAVIDKIATRADTCATLKFTGKFKG